MNDDDRATLETDPWFGALPRDRQAALISQARSRTVETGWRVYAIGDQPNGLWAVLQGQVRIKGYPAPGLEFLALGVEPGGWFGEVSTLDDGPRPHDATAHGPTRLLHLPTSAFHAIAEQTPGLYLDLGRLVCRHQRLALDFIAQTVALPLEVRLARLLDSRIKAAGDRLAIRQEDLAVMLSVSRQTLNRHLKQMADAGVIGVSYGGLKVLDRARLRSFAGIDGPATV